MMSALVGCTPGPQEAAASLSVEEWLPLKIGAVEISAQIVLSREEQRKGLMYREALAPNSGMLFPYPGPRQLSFWMKNTKIPLDIGFFDESGLLMEVHRMVPFDTNRTTSNSREVQFALEMNTGWFSRNSLFPGQRLDMELLGKALLRRGADPGKFGISE